MDVTITFTATDNLSGVVSVTEAVTVTTERANQHIGGEAVDLAGNTATTYVTLNIDKTAPAITINVPLNEAEYLLKQSVIADWSVTDNLSGLESSSGTLPSGQAIDTASPGTKIFSVSGQDRAGNSSTQTNKYYVRYRYLGILPPINPDGSSVFKLGRTVPVKFQLKDANGNYITNAVAKIYLAKISDNVAGQEVEGISPGEANTGNLFRYDNTDNLYIFNLATGGLSSGTWQARIVLDDGTSQYVNFSLK